jgi:hypothetical protein
MQTPCQNLKKVLMARKDRAVRRFPHDLLSHAQGSICLKISQRKSNAYKMGIYSRRSCAQIGRWSDAFCESAEICAPWPSTAMS